MDEIVKEKVDSIREVFLYLKRFRGRSFVIKIDYPILNASVLPVLVRDLAQLRELGIKILIVVGARDRIDEVLERYGIENKMHGTTRISPPDAMPFIKMAAFDAANRIMTLLTANKISAVIGNWVRARTLGVKDGIDFMSTGEVEKIRTDPLNRLMEDEIVPIFPCIGWNTQGTPYNISSDHLAGALARAIGAEKLFYVTSEIGTWPSRLSVSEAEAFIKSSKQYKERERNFIQLALETCKSGVDRVHIVDGTKEGTILQEIFSNLGSGTMVYANQYEKIRGMEIDDIPDVLRIMEPWIADGHLVARDEATMELDYKNYFVYEVDGSIHGCGGICEYEGKKAELVGLTVDKQYLEFRIGSKIVEFLVQEARENGIEELFLLTTQAFDWFEQLGFEQAELSRLPKKRVRTYDTKRNSRIMCLTLRSE